jgi:ankyrin repeat protein
MRGNGGMTPLMSAIHSRHFDVARELIRRGASINVHDDIGRTALIIASYVGDVSIVRELIRHDAKVNATDLYGKTPLHTATISGHLAIVQELIRHGARVNPRDKQGVTPLMNAVFGGHTRIIHALISAGANPTYRNTFFGRSARSLGGSATRQAIRTSKPASKWVSVVRKRRAERMLLSPRLLGSTSLPNNIIRSISKLVTVKKQKN